MTTSVIGWSHRSCYHFIFVISLVTIATISGSLIGRSRAAAGQRGVAGLKTGPVSRAQGQRQSGGLSTQTSSPRSSWFLYEETCRCNLQTHSYRCWTVTGNMNVSIGAAHLSSLHLLCSRLLSFLLSTGSSFSSILRWFLNNSNTFLIVAAHPSSRRPANRKLAVEGLAFIQEG